MYIRLQPLISIKHPQIHFAPVFSMYPKDINKYSFMQVREFLARLFDVTPSRKTFWSAQRSAQKIKRFFWWHTKRAFLRQKRPWNNTVLSAASASAAVRFRSRSQWLGKELCEPSVWYSILGSVPMQCKSKGRTFPLDRKCKEEQRPDGSSSFRLSKLHFWITKDRSGFSLFLSSSDVFSIKIHKLIENLLFDT